MHNDPNLFAALLILIFVILIAETRLSAKWNSFYFLKGPVIFLKKFKITSHGSINDLSKALENNFSGSYLPSLLFKNIDQNVIAFREKLFEFVLLTYTPVMHGTVGINNTATEITIRGRANWFPMVFSLFWLLSNPFGVFGIIFYIGLISLLYSIQYYRFTKVGDTILKILKANINT